MDKIVNEYKIFEQVKAIAIGGSSAARTSDSVSDIDLYVFTDNDIPLSQRKFIVKKYSSKYEVGGEYFGSGDEFLVDEINRQLDVMFWNVEWFKSEVENVWVKCYPKNAYTTAFLYTLNNFEIKYDPDGYLGNLQKLIKTEYPERLRKNIIKRNIMLLKDKPFASYYEQIDKAVKRKDLNSINHRVAAFMASYFDIIFAVNKLFHPGEKRLVNYALNNCKVLPKDFEYNITRIFNSNNDNILDILDDMVGKLREIIN